MTILVDEFYFHRKRGLPLWERIGHPLDSFSFLLCLAVPLFFSYSESALWVYAALAVFSCLFITKDEWVHAQYAAPAEHWLHALLFMFHPLALIATAWLWFAQNNFFILYEFLSVLALFFYQIIYWNFLWQPSTTDSTTI